MNRVVNNIRWCLVGEATVYFLAWSAGVVPAWWEAPATLGLIVAVTLIARRKSPTTESSIR